MKLILIRHGQTEWNVEQRLQGWSDSPLTKQAIHQMYEMALPELDNPKLYSSDLGRARESAQILAERLKLELVLDQRLRERGFGILEGKLVDADVALAEQWHSYRYRYQHKMLNVDGVEPERYFEQRIMAFLQHLSTERTSEAIIVSHGECLRALCNIIVGRPSWHAGQGIMPNAVPMIVDWTPSEHGFAGEKRI